MLVCTLYRTIISQQWKNLLLAQISVMLRNDLNVGPARFSNEQHRLAWSLHGELCVERYEK